MVDAAQVEADRPGGALARRGFLTGLVGVCSGCLLTACSTAAAPTAAPSAAASSSGGSSGASGGGPTRATHSSRGPGRPSGRATSPASSRPAGPTTTPDASTPTGGGGSGSNGGSTGGDRPSRSPSATSEPSPRHTRSPDPSPTPTSSDPGSALAEVSAVPVGGALVLPQYRVVLTQPTAGVVHGFGAMCTHQGCLVGDGGGLLQCPCHGSQFSLSDGSVIQGPAPRSLPAQKVRVVDGWVYPA